MTDDSILMNDSYLSITDLALVQCFFTLDEVSHET